MALRTMRRCSIRIHVRGSRMPHSIVKDAAFSAAQRATRASSRVLDLLSHDPASIDFHDAHEALVNSILANITFANAARTLLQRIPRSDDPMYRANASYPPGGDGAD